MSEKYKYTYIGNLELYHETGMEALGCILHDDRGTFQSESYNPNTGKWDGPLEDMRSVEWTLWFRGGERIKVLNPEDHSVVYEGLLTKNQNEMIRQNFSFTFIPSEIKTEDWLIWCQKEYRAIVESNLPVLAEQDNSLNFINNSN
jgi:hypothetical protein